MESKEMKMVWEIKEKLSEEFLSMSPEQRRATKQKAIERLRKQQRKISKAS